MSSNNGEIGGFEVIAMDNVKSKKTAKGGSLGDLLKCVDSLASSTESLRDFTAITDPQERSQFETYLQGLMKIQDGLLEKAQEKIRELGRIPAVQDGVIGVEDPGKVAKQ